MTNELCDRRLQRRVKLTRRYRTKLDFTPTWDKKFSGWAANFIRKNQWRCDGIHEFDDLMQDAYLCFLKVCERYPRVVNPRQFMTLFQTTLRNKLHDHARYMKRKREAYDVVPIDVSECVTQPGESTNSGYVSALLARAPITVKRAIDLVVQEPEALEEVPPPPFKGYRENLNTRVARILRVDQSFRFESELRSLLA